MLGAAVAITLAVGAMTFLPVCHVHFDCGCVALWAGAASHCDIRDPEPPNCPWCHHPWMGWAVMGVSSVAGIASIVATSKRTRLPTATLAGLAAFHAALLALGVVTSLALELPVLAALR